MSSFTPFHLTVLEKCLEYGDRVALTDDTESITFDELRRRCYQVAHLLREQGVGKGDSLLVFLPNSNWYPIIFLGAALLGCTISGVSPESTNSELVYYYQKASAKFIICPAEHICRVKEAELSNIITLGSSSAVSIPRDLEPFIPSEPVEDILPSDILIMPFSSGTSGKPKCVMLTHENYNTCTELLKRALFDQLAEETMRLVTIAALPLHHGSGFWAMMYCILSGFHTIVMNKFHPMLMLQHIEKHKVNILNVVPSIVGYLVRMRVDGLDLSSLTTVLCGSSPLGAELSAAFLQKFPSVQNLIQGYGMTEAVLLSHITPMGLVSTEEKRLGSCGQLIPGYEAKLVREDGQIVKAPKELGELHLRSKTIMKGYKDSDEESVDEEGWYRTGDVLYYDEDGFYFVVDRVKDLIKVHGMQVSPSELEDVLLAHDLVAEAAVVGVPDTTAGQLPKAFVVLVEGADSARALKTLDTYMKVAVAPFKQLRGGLEIRSELPRTASGKVMRRLLRTE